MSNNRIASVKRALGNDVSDEVAEEWLNVAGLKWVLRHGLSLRSVGLTVEDAKDLVRRLGADINDVGVVLQAARLAGLNARWIHLWAGADFVRNSHATDTGSGPKREHAAPWVTKARTYVAATGGDERIAAVSAAAGLTAEQAAALESHDDTTFQMLHVFASLREQGERLA